MLLGGYRGFCKKGEHNLISLNHQNPTRMMIALRTMIQKQLGVVIMLWLCGLGVRIQGSRVLGFRALPLILPSPHDPEYPKLRQYNDTESAGRGHFVVELWKFWAISTLGSCSAAGGRTSKVACTHDWCLELGEDTADTQNPA